MLGQIATNLSHLKSRARQVFSPPTGSKVATNIQAWPTPAISF